MSMCNQSAALLLSISTSRWIFPKSHANNEGEIIGCEIVDLDCEDEIEIKHTANNRDGFAMGAIIAAEWIQNKQGIFNMQDVLTQ